MSYYVVQTNFQIEHGPFRSFEAAVIAARAIGFECSIWDAESRTNWGRQLVGAVSPISGLRDLRAFGGREG